MDSITALIDDGAIVITANDHLARDLQVRYSVSRREEGKQVWERATIMSIRRWVIQSWESCWPEMQLLHPVQELALYKSAIDRSGRGRDLLSTTGAARAVRRAASLVRRYRIDMTRCPEWDAEGQVFREWLAWVEKERLAMGWATEADIADDLIDFIRAGKCAVPTHVVLAGFIHATPQETDLWDALRSRGCLVVELRNVPIAANVQFIRPLSPDKEARAAATIAQKHLAEFIADPSSAPRIAILVPDLNVARERLERALLDVLLPHRVLPSTQEKPIPWRYGRGTSLSDQEVVNAAMTVLQLRQTGNDANLITRLLLNRHVGSGSEMVARAAIDYELRSGAGPQVSLSRVYRLAESESHTKAPLLATRIKCLVDSLTTENDAAIPSTWAKRYRDRLKCVGWPGEKSLHSSVYQAVSKLEECLDALSAMDRQLGKVSPEVAFAWLRETVATRDHQPRVQYGQPIQVLEWQDAIGLRFDVAIVLGLESDALPAHPDPSPFVPLELQRERRIPDASPELCLEQAQALLRELEQIAPESTWSCPRTREDGTEISASLLVPALQTATDAGPEFVSHRETIIAAGQLTVLPASDDVPPVVDTVLEGLHGGSSLLTHFFSMPFVAFARNRLGVYPFPLPVPGLTADVQGNCVHAVLEHLLQSNPTRGAVRAIVAGELEKTAEEAVENVLNQRELMPAWRYGEMLVRLERKRIATVIADWLRVEADRQHEFEVLGLEHACEVVIRGLALKLRADRIDRVISDDGAHTLIIDYKTGSEVNPADWNPASLAAPQLPLYATTRFDCQGESLSADGIAYAHVRRGKCRFHLRSSWTDVVAGVPGKNALVPDWDGLRREWMQTFDEAVRQILHGEASGDPKALQRHMFHSDLSRLLPQRHISRIEVKG